MGTWITLALLTFITCGLVKGNCPPPSQIAPCTCIDNEVVNCSRIHRSSSLDNVFKRNPNWDFPSLVIDKCVMRYIPKSIMELASFKSLNITNSYFVTLFDAIPLKENRLQWLVLSNVKVLTGFDWRLFSTTTSLMYLTVYDSTIRTFDASFREGFPSELIGIYLENTRTSKITHQAFSKLNYTEVISIKKSFLRKISRDMFPKYWRSIFWLDFSYNKLKSLPEDMFNDMPNLKIVYLENNRFSTIPEKPFNIRRTEILHVFYFLDGNPLVCDCGIKWITSASEDFEMYGECDKPKKYEGRQISSLTQKDFSYCA